MRDVLSTFALTAFHMCAAACVLIIILFGVMATTGAGTPAVAQALWNSLPFFGTPAPAFLTLHLLTAKR